MACHEEKLECLPHPLFSSFFSHVARLSFTYLINFYFTWGAFTFFLEWKSPTRKFLISSIHKKKKFSSFANCQSSLMKETKFCSNFHILLSVFEKAINFHHHCATTTWKFSPKLFSRAENKFESSWLSISVIGLNLTAGSGSCYKRQTDELARCWWLG